MLTDNELVAQYRAGDETAFATLLEQYRGMIHTIINRYQKWLITSDRDDLYQEASLAILKAIQTYDIDRGAKFTSYAWKQVEWHLSKYIERDSLIQLPAYRCRAESTSKLCYTRSIDAPLYTDNESANLANTLPAPPVIEEEEAENASVTHCRKVLSKTLATIAPRNADIIKARLRRDTFEIIGERLGITKEYVRQIEARTIITIRNSVTKTEGNLLVPRPPDHITRYGHDCYGNQRVRCLRCGRVWIRKKSKPLGDMRIDKSRAVLCLKLLMEGIGILSAARIACVNKNTIPRLLEIVGRRASRYVATKIPNLLTIEWEHEYSETIRCMSQVVSINSKKWKYHEHRLAICFLYYNFCRVHSTIKTTPAIKAGIANRPWTLEELLDELVTQDVVPYFIPSSSVRVLS